MTKFLYLEMVVLSDERWEMFKLSLYFKKMTSYQKLEFKQKYLTIPMHLLFFFRKVDIIWILYYIFGQILAPRENIKPPRPAW
jgi:hypothetical protein